MASGFVTVRRLLSDSLDFVLPILYTARYLLLYLQLLLLQMSSIFISSLQVLLGLSAAAEYAPLSLRLEPAFSFGHEHILQNSLFWFELGSMLHLWLMKVVG